MFVRNVIMSLTAGVAGILPISIKRSFYKIPGLSRIIRESLNTLVPKGLSEVSIFTGNFPAFVMQLDLQTEKDYWLGTYEPELQSAIWELTKPGMIVYDVGANIGFTSLLFALRAGSTGHIFSFEALPSNVNRLKYNIALNKFQGRDSVIHGAVQDRSGKVDFLVGPSHGTGKIVGSLGRSTMDYQGRIQIPGVSIDDFIFQDGNDMPDIIKIDIEGGELLALQGMQRLLEHHRPILMLEIHGPEAAKSCWELLEKQKYPLSEMTHGYPHVDSVTELVWKSYLVAFPD